MGRHGPQAPWVLAGPMDGTSFCVWVEKVFVPILVKGDIVVMDNLSVHKNNEARDAIQSVGADMWDLPPYSPNLNPIATMWSKIKALLRQAKARTPEDLLKAMGEALGKVNATVAAHVFASSGYSLI